MLILGNIFRTFTAIAFSSGPRKHYGSFQTQPGQV